MLLTLLNYRVDMGFLIWDSVIMKPQPSFISRQQAIATGSKRYFTGDACKNGHVGERLTSSRTCVECKRVREATTGRPAQYAACQKWRENNRDKASQSTNNWRDNNPGKVREWKDNNRDKLKLYKATWERSNPDKLHAQQKRSYARRSDSIKLYQKGYRERTYEVRKQKNLEWRLSNTDRMRETRKAWRENNYERVKASQKARSSRLRAQLKMLTKEQKKEIETFYAACPDGYHVDHIHPLKGENFCGLHVIGNLQYLPAAENIAKKNRMPAEDVPLLSGVTLPRMAA